MEEYALNWVEASELLIDAVAALEIAHVSFALLKFCLGVCKINYLRRETAVQCTRRVAPLFDKRLDEAPRTIAGEILDHKLFLKLQLPANGAQIKRIPTLGLGSTSAITTPSSALLASAASSNGKADASLGEQETPKGLKKYEAGQHAYDT